MPESFFAPACCLPWFLGWPPDSPWRRLAAARRRVALRIHAALRILIRVAFAFVLLVLILLVVVLLVVGIAAHRRRWVFLLIDQRIDVLEDGLLLAAGLGPRVGARELVADGLRVLDDSLDDLEWVFFGPLRFGGNGIAGTVGANFAGRRRDRHVAAQSAPTTSARWRPRTRERCALPFGSRLICRSWRGFFHLE